MRKYVIYNQESKLSVESAQKCIEVAKNIGKIDVEMWNGISRYDSKEKVQEYDLSLDKTFLHLKDDIRNWTQHSFEDSVVGCFLSHYSLWKESIRTNERILILEHDALFTKKFEDFIFEGVLNLVLDCQNQLVGKKIASDSRISLVSATGSTRMGKSVAEVVG